MRGDFKFPQGTTSISNKGTKPQTILAKVEASVSLWKMDLHNIYYIETHWHEGGYYWYRISVFPQTRSHLVACSSESLACAHQPDVKASHMAPMFASSNNSIVNAHSIINVI